MDDEKVIEFQSFYESLAPNSSKIYLYRVINSKTTYLAKYDILPDIDEIANDFGGGNYQIALKYKDPKEMIWKTKTQSLSVDESFSKRLGSSPAGQQDQFDTFIGRSFGMVEKMISVLSPLIRPQIATTANEQQVALMNKMMSENFKTQQNLLKEYAMQVKQDTHVVDDEEYDDDDEEQPPEEKGSPMETIINGLIEKYLPALLGDGVQSKVVANMITGSQEFQDISSDQSKANLLVQYMIKQIGEEKTNLVLKKLGLI